MLGYCGVSCTKCPCYQGTHNADIGLLEQTARLWSKGGEALRAVDMICLGCAQDDPMYEYCRTCEIRRCARGKGVSLCAACPEYEGCEMLQSFLGGQDVPHRKMWSDLLRVRFKGGRG